MVSHGEPSSKRLPISGSLYFSCDKLWLRQIKDALQKKLGRTVCGRKSLRY